jgi:hypothetical protein
MAASLLELILGKNAFQSRRGNEMRARIWAAFSADSGFLGVKRQKKNELSTW